MAKGYLRFFDFLLSYDNTQGKRLPLELKTPPCIGYFNESLTLNLCFEAI
jgi:hypothetical protein